MALTPLKPPSPPKFPSYQLGRKPVWSTGVKRPNMVAARSVQPYAGPAPGQDYGQNALYPGGYNLPKNPANMGTFFTTGPGAISRGNFDQGASREVMSPLTDYGALINGDWEVQDAEAAMGAQMARARGDFQAGLRQQFIDLGLPDTSKLGQFGKYIDANTIKEAIANKYSTTAQNQQEATRARDTNNAALAARGILNSGATTKAQTDVTAGQEGANYAGLRGFLEGGSQGLTSLADREFSLAQGVAQARAAAAQRAAMFGPGGDPTGFDQYGLSTDYSQTRNTAAATAAAQRQMVNQQLNQQLAAQRRAAAARRNRGYGPRGRISGVRGGGV